MRPPMPPGGPRRPGPGGPVPPGGHLGAGGPGGPRRPGGPGGPGPDRRPGEEPTDMLPALTPPPPPKREPDLLTHREADEEIDAFYEGDEDDYDDELTDDEERALRRKKIWRRVRRVSYVALGLMILSPVVAFAIAYQVIDVPNPEDVAAKQGKAITLLYSDGSPMTTIADSGSNRSMITYEELPEVVKNAVFAAEDPTFMTNPGFDFTAIARAVWYQVKGGDSGGSGLTQQYVKKATEDESATLTRKFNEMVRAYKMSKQQKKEDILAAYLNTIYFGRSAYGVKTAAKMYFNKDLKDVSQAEAALLAGMIQNPGRSEETEYVKERWEYVRGQLVKNGMIDQATADSMAQPPMAPLEEVTENALTGPRAFIQQQVFYEMAREPIGMTQEDAGRKGVVIHTTIDKKMQQAAEDSVNEVMKGEPEELKTSLTGIDPKSGAVLAYYGGSDGMGLDYATGTIQEAGSSFKPFDLVAALEDGFGLGSPFDGVSPKSFPGMDTKIRNASDPQNKCGPECPLREAMKLSLNTVFYDLVFNHTGAEAVAEAAWAAGIPKQVSVGGQKIDTLLGEGGAKPNTGIALGGDVARVRPFDMASAYATFAARGVHHEPFFVSKITDSSGETILHQHIDQKRDAFDTTNSQLNRDIADNVTEALKPIPLHSKIACAGNRECAGKTGTHELPDDASQNSKAWMVGYTKSLSTSVWMGRNEGNVALKNAAGQPIFGGGLPGQIWKKFMDKALDGTPKETFDKAKPLGQYNDPVKTTSAKPSTPSSAPPSSTSRSREEDDDKSTPPSPSRSNGNSSSTPNTGITCLPGLCPNPDPRPTGGPNPDPAIGGGRNDGGG
ncbi:penicillin-binding protein [Actinosynnema pretiosum subsp. pretiosum]|uniref:Glycosyl transferase family 51 n=2 Tax=Actinosynnema TaxID=40566 RepID=C6WSF6_ACTMD|nr:transglycosylase domain-containing protein [Actinosynnema mirum]ACU40826.1 glycosyl transferase family 51 [Actinosynnema mirum DSM 43827]QUF01965.1 penicillin-binding protein [Actinosynnema pretiosum subsp. pretiosum]